METPKLNKILRALDVLVFFMTVVLFYVYFSGTTFFRIGNRVVDFGGFINVLYALLGLFIIRHIISLLFKGFEKKTTMLWYYLGLAIISAASLLMEVTMTRIFSVSFFSHFAFLIISTALFGFGFSGVALSIIPYFKRVDLNKAVVAFSLLFAISVIITLKIVVEVPLRFSELKTNPVNYLYLAVYFISLAVPFFFNGVVVALILSRMPKKINRLYFSNLIGAGMGCFLIMPLVPALGASGAVIFAAIMGGVAALFFGKMLSKKSIVLAIAVIILLAMFLPFRETLFFVNVHEIKRSYNLLEETGQIEFSRWGPISRIDVAAFGLDKIIWIDGGSNQGFMKPFDGNLEKEEPSWRAGIVYFLKPDADVLIVGPCGGEEVLYALTHKPKSLVGVELDPVIVDIVQNEYRDFIGGIYNMDNVELINDEGRSFIKRSTDKYDIIQQINNSSPVAIASGALNVSETYLITVNAFKEYIEHLKEDGFIYIRRWGAVRLATVAVQAMKELGIENPEKRIIILTDPLHQYGGGQFYYKNGSYTEEELDFFNNWIAGFEGQLEGVYGPEGLNITHHEYELYKNLIETEGFIEAYYDETGIDMSPVNDNRPFFNHFTRFGGFRTTDKVPEFLLFNSNITDHSLIVILLEAAFLSIIFIILPLYLFKRKGLKARGKLRFMGYFASLGLAFILIEIVFIQKFTLFMGNPTYSVTVVLFSMLTAAGCGSFISSRFKEKPQKALMFIIPGIVLISVLLLFLSPSIFSIFLGYSTFVRILVSVLLIFPLGIVMGMPFPLGIRVTSSVSEDLIPWVWGINGYTTVIGSVLCVILALTMGFRAVIFFACGVYIFGLILISTVKKADKTAS